MALQSEVSPPIVGDPNTVKQIEGDTKSDENDPSQSTDEDVDLEDGEILDSGAEEEEEKDFTNSSLKEALDKSCLLSIEELVNQAKNAKTIGSPNHSKVPTPRKMNKMSANYLDHDRNENSSDHDDGWAPKFKTKFDDKPIDYRMELEAYRGTPPSSPDRKRRDEKSRKKKSSKKSKKSRKTIKRKDIKGMRVKHREAPRGKICKFYIEGKCVKGSDCLFSHPSPSSFKKKELCKFYLNGHCNKGKDCLYMHSEFPCKFYHTGSECYARDDCRFSHAPLTEEMTRVLADYLRMSHGDDVRLNRDERVEERGRDRERDRDRKRRVSHSPETKPPSSKRTCLLGSPPRHIREAEETKLWQEEMKMLQSQNHPGFEIHLSSDHENMSPPQFAKPNFYNETMLNTPSPKRRQGRNDGPNTFKGNSMDDYSDGSPTKVYVYDEDEFIEITVPPVKQQPPEEYQWKNAQNNEENHIKSYDNSQQDLDFTNDVKFDETTQFSEMESSIDGPPALSPDQANQSYALNDCKDSDDTSNQEAIRDTSDKTSDDANGDSSQEPLPPSIVVPSHLPRRQQELLMRVLQHQRKTPASDVTNSPTSGDNADIVIKKEEPEEEVEIKSESMVNDSKWYSSEDDDDDSDQPLTDVLKKIQQAPPAKPQTQDNKPQVNILDMFNKIQQKTMESKGLSKSSPQPANAFWANILQGTAPKSASALSPIPVGEPKRRTLLPDPILPGKKMDPAISKEPVVIKDPRLKNRDPRKLANASNPTLSIPKSSIDGNNLSDNSPSIHETNSLFSKPLGAVTGEPTKENIPYRLRGICSNPPNYTPYLSASQSNPNLLKDPRLRKHLLPSVDESVRNGKDQEVVKPAPPKDAPPIPELLLKYQKPVSAINIFESSSSTKRSTETTPQEPKPSLSIFPQKIYDPRMRRRDSRSNSNSSSDTPPHLTIVDSVTTPPQQEFKTAPVLENATAEPAVEKKWLPPVLEKFWTPLSLEKSWTSLPVKEEESILKEKLVIKEEPCIKEEPISDSESNHEPPKLDMGKDASYKKSSPLKEEFITVIKTEVSQDSNNDSHPVVPPLIIKKIKPTVASHLPRAIADPRMAKLHNRVDPRRHRLSGPETKSIVECKKQPLKAEESKLLKDTITESKTVTESSNVESACLDVPKSLDEVEKGGEKEEKHKEGKAIKEEKAKSTKSIPKKRRLSDREEKKRTVHRNRKSSMDYASPLNSCDSTNVNKSLDYNSYNQRPKRTVNEKPPVIDVSPLPESSDTSSIPDFALSDNSNLECDNSNEVNLKDRFKTIDPTASPFC